MASPLTALKRFYRIPAIMLGLTLFLAFAGLYGMGTTGDAMEELYAGRVVPLRALKDVSDAYAVYVVDASHKAQIGLISPGRALASITTAQATIDRQWQAYAVLPHRGKEALLSARAGPLIANGNAAILDLRHILAARDMAALAEFRAHRLYQTIDPITGLISRLTVLQLGEAKRVHDAAVARNQILLLVIIAALLGAIAIGIAARRSEAAGRQAREAARLARERLRVIIEGTADIVCTVDRNGRFIEMSENCAAIWGWRREALIGRSFTDFASPEDIERTYREFDLATRRGSQHRLESVYVRPDGARVTMSWSVIWIEEEQLYHCVGRDMTEHKALEAQAHRAQRMEAIGQLTGGIAHDFNNLLTIVMGSSETIAEQATQPELRTLAGLINKAARQGAELTRHLLAYSRRQPLAPRAFDVPALLDGLAPLIRRALGGGLQLAIETTGGPGTAFADPAQTEAAILNLCLNARDAMPQGGRLTIRATRMTLSAEAARHHADTLPGDYVAIAVSDSGSGIAPELVDRVFEPFFTTKEVGKGSGLGLSMVYGFVRQSDGFLDLASVPDRGTTITLHLPVADMLAADAGAPVADERAIARGSEKLLLVDDDDVVREHVRGQLEAFGYRVTAAACAADAMDIIDREEPFDLLFTDIVMAGGMNGRQLGERAAARMPGLRILYTSGYSRDALTEEGRLAEGITLLAKPFSRQQLADKVRAVLDEPIPSPAKTL